MKTKVKMTCRAPDGVKLEARKAPIEGLCTGCHMLSGIWEDLECMKLRPKWFKDEMPLFCDMMNIVWVERKWQ